MFYTLEAFTGAVCAAGLALLFGWMIDTAIKRRF